MTELLKEKVVLGPLALHIHVLPRILDIIPISSHED